MTLTEFLILLAIAGICGSVAQAIVGYTRGGCLMSVALGFIGALVGPLVADTFNLPRLLVIQVNEQPFPIVWSIIGAVLVVLIVGILTPKRRH